MRQRLSLAALLLRVTVGVVFVSAGADKVLRGPAYSPAYFESLGVVWPELTGPLVSWLEVIAGLSLILGFLTILSGIYLASEMVIVLMFIRLPQAALATSLTEAITTLRLEATLAVAATAVVLIGPGLASIDGLLRKRNVPPWARRGDQKRRN